MAGSDAKWGGSTNGPDPVPVDWSTEFSAALQGVQPNPCHFKIHPNDTPPIVAESLIKAFNRAQPPNSDFSAEPVTADLNTVHFKSETGQSVIGMTANGTPLGSGPVTLGGMTVQEIAGINATAAYPP